MERWMITFDDENWENNTFPTFDSFEAAESFIKENNNEKGVQILYKNWCEENGYDMSDFSEIVCTAGRIKNFKPKVFGDDVIERLREQAHDFTAEYSEGYLERVSEDAINSLTVALTVAYSDWEERFKQQPFFYVIDRQKVINI